MSRPIPLPVSPHLKESHVLKMVDEAGQEIPENQPWPPTNRLPGAPRPHDFLSKCSSASGERKVAWPPHLDTEGINDEYLLEQDPTYQKPDRNQDTTAENQNETGPHLATSHPSGFKLRDEAPVSQPGVLTVPSQPAFKITMPKKVSGDSKWPPRRAGEGEGEDVSQEEVREFIRPKKATRDYSEFFAQNALPNNYPSYRAPPGTQHRDQPEGEVPEE